MSCILNSFTAPLSFALSDADFGSAVGFSQEWSLSFSSLLLPPPSFFLSPPSSLPLSSLLSPAATEAAHSQPCPLTFGPEGSQPCSGCSGGLRAAHFLTLFLLSQNLDSSFHSSHARTLALSSVQNWYQQFFQTCVRHAGLQGCHVR